MNSKAVAVVLLSTTIFAGVVFSASEDAFVDVDEDVRRLQRNLLQADEEKASTEAPAKETTEAPKKKGKFVHGEYSLGPKLFYDAGNFAMEVGSPIKVTIFDGEDPKKRLSTVRLDAPALSVKGSMINADKTDFKVNLDWKQQNFGTDLKISSIQINMYFKRKNDEYFMYNMDVVRLHIGSRQINSLVLEVEDRDGYKIAAPVGSSFTCSDLGMFKPALNETSSYKIGVTFPDVQLQAFHIKHNFGPAWDCENLMPVGLLIGIIFTLFFAFVCYWGFSMLASINTMDRFDDPKGKQIYIPQSD